VGQLQVGLRVKWKYRSLLCARPAVCVQVGWKSRLPALRLKQVTQPLLWSWASCCVATESKSPDHCCGHERAAVLLQMNRDVQGLCGAAEGQPCNFAADDGWLPIRLQG
jgi:hypothetical protein